MEAPGGGDVDRGRAAAIIMLVQLSIALIVVALRLYARFVIKNLGPDDWLMLITVILFAIYAGLMTYNWKLGGFRHLYYLTMDEVLRVTKLNYIIQVVVIFSYVTGKAAVGFLVLRVIGRDPARWRKWAVYTVITMTALSNCIDIILTYAQCSPPRALWDPSVPHTCWNPEIQTHFAIYTGAENCAADVVLAVVPATLILRLNMDMKKRVNLCILLSLGLIAAICCIVKTTYLGNLSAHSDITWKTYDLLVWSGSELFVIIVCGSIPPLKPYLDRFSGKSMRQTTDPERSGNGYEEGRLSSSRQRSRSRGYRKEEYEQTSSSMEPVMTPELQGGKWVQNPTDVELRAPAVRHELDSRHVSAELESSGGHHNSMV